MLMIWFLLILVFTVQAEVTGVINVDEPDAPETAAPTATPAITPTTATAETPAEPPEKESGWGAMLIIAFVIVVLALAAYMKAYKITQIRPKPA